MSFVVLRAQSQISPEYTYTGVSASYVKLPEAGYKYYVMDVANKQCRFYNNDHSLWKTINLSVPANYFLYDIKFVSEDLFNTDNTIEFLYVSYNYNTAQEYYTYDTRIADETGKILLSVPGGGYSDIYPSQNGSKLFVWVYDYSTAIYKVNTQVYSIPGQVTTALPEMSVSSNMRLPRAFPNPATTSITIPYFLPQHINQAELKLYGMSGNLVKTFLVDRAFDHLSIQIGDLPAGMYVYRIETAFYKSDSYKVTINK